MSGEKRKTALDQEQEADLYDLLDLGDVSEDLADIMSAAGGGDLLDLMIESGGGDESATECDYDSVSSPGGSTCSGPIYIRHTGFGPGGPPPLSDGTPSPGRLSPPPPLTCPPPQVLQRDLLSRHHRPLRLPGAIGTDKLCSGGHGSEAKKKKKKSLLCPDLVEAVSSGKREIRGLPVAAGKMTAVSTSGMAGGSSGLSGNRPKHKKEPLPMKLRALPQSFWLQPNQANPLPPGSVYSTLPPLPGQEVETEPRERTVSEANTDLLFSLFNMVEHEEDEAKRKIHLIRRGRPRKPPSFQRTRMLQDDDPYLVSNVTESILPLIPERGGNNSVTASNRHHQPQPTQVIRIMSISHGDKSVDLPSLNVEHNYPHLLSELVLKL